MKTDVSDRLLFTTGTSHPTKTAGRNCLESRLQRPYPQRWQSIWGMPVEHRGKEALFGRVSGVSAYETDKISRHGGQMMKYTEIFVDENDVSHFRDIQVTFTQGEVAPPALPLGMSEFYDAAQIGFLSAPAGWDGGWHQPPSDGFIILLRGEAEIEVGDGEKRIFKTGDVWRHRDNAGRGHNTRMIGSDDALAAIIHFAAPGV